MWELSLLYYVYVNSKLLGMTLTLRASRSIAAKTNP